MLNFFCDVAFVEGKFWKKQAYTLAGVDCSTGYRVSAFGMDDESFSIMRCNFGEVCSDVQANVSFPLSGKGKDATGKIKQLFEEIAKFY